MNETSEVSAPGMRGSHKERELPQGLAADLVDAIDALIDWIGRIAAWVGLGLVVLVTLNVALRYLFRFSLVSLQELEWHLIPPIVMIGTAYALRHREHVRVDLLFERFPIWLRHLVDILVAVVLVIICVVVIYVSVPWVLQAYNMNEGSPDPGGLSYRFILKAFIPFGFLLLLIQAVADGIRNVLLLFNRLNR